MRNIKVLWGVIGLLLVCVLVLTARLAISPSGISDTDAARNPDPHIQDNEAERNRIVAKIGERSITKGELDQKLEAKHGAELLNQFLDQEAVRLEAGSLQLNVSDTEIDDELARMQQGYDSEEEYYKSMKDQLGMTKAELRIDVYNKLLLEKVATYSIPVSDKQVSDYISSHPEEFTTVAQLHIQQMILSDKQEADDAIHELNNGADFEALVRERSIEANSSESGGDIGWVEVDDPFVQPKIMEAAKNLEVDAYSGPIRLDDGYAIVKLLGRTEETRMNSRKVREIVRKELALNAAPPLKEVVAKLRTKWNASIVDDTLK